MRSPKEPRQVFVAILLSLLCWNVASAQQTSRTWSDDTGSYKVEATLLSTTSSSVRLLKSNGVEIDVPFSRLSKADRAHLAEIFSRNARKISKPKKQASGPTIYSAQNSSPNTTPVNTTPVNQNTNSIIPSATATQVESSQPIDLPQSTQTTLPLKDSELTAPDIGAAEIGAADSSREITDPLAESTTTETTITPNVVGNPGNSESMAVVETAETNTDDLAVPSDTNIATASDETELEPLMAEPSENVSSSLDNTLNSEQPELAQSQDFGFDFGDMQSAEPDGNSIESKSIVARAQPDLVTSQEFDLVNFGDAPPATEDANKPEPEAVKLQNLDLSQASEELRPLLRQLAEADDHAAQVEALKLVRSEWPENTRDAIAVKAIKQCLESPTPIIRKYAIGILVQRDAEQSFDRILTCVEDEDFGVRWFAYDSLSKIGNPSAIDKLVECLGGTDTEQVANTLVSFGNQVEPKILHLLSDERKVLRQYACRILAKVGSPQSLPMLREMVVNEKDLRVRLQASNAIAQINERNSVAAN